MIGLDISDASLKIIQLSAGSERKLLGRSWEAVPSLVMVNGVVQQPKILRELIFKALKSGGQFKNPLKDSLVASIPETQSFLRVVEIPEMRVDEVTEAVQWEVAQHIPFGLENVYLDWQPLTTRAHASDGKMEVLVGASQKRVVDPLYAVLSEMGIDVAAFELESQAIVRALVSPGLRRTQGLLVVDLGATSTNVVVHDHGTMRFTASLQKGVQAFMSMLNPHDASLLSGQPGALPIAEGKRIAEKFKGVQEELVTEIKSIVEFYNSIDAEHVVREIILTGGGANLPGFDTIFVESFDSVHVQRGNPWVNVLSSGKQATLPLQLQESVHYTTAIGLALRETVI